MMVSLEHAQLAILNPQRHIISEFSELKSLLSSVDPLIGILGSARIRPDCPVYRQCYQAALMLSRNGFSVVTGGGNGLMTAANLGASQGLRQSIGIIIESEEKICCNPYQHHTVIVPNVDMRKQAFAQCCSAIIAFPGGIGTLDEVMAILLHNQYHPADRKMCILVGSDFWQNLIGWMKTHLLAQGLINSTDLEMVHTIDDIDSLSGFLKKTSADK